MHQEVLENLQSIHGALLRMNRSIQAEGTFGIIKYDCWYKRIVRRGLESNGRAVENGIRSTPFFYSPYLCHSENKPPALQGEGRSLDISKSSCAKIDVGLQTTNISTGGPKMDKNSLAHTKWDCKYHIVFAPKYRRQVIYKDIKADVGQILGTLCRRKGIEIIEAECCPDHIHMLVRIPPKYSVSEIMGYLKGKS